MEALGSKFFDELGIAAVDGLFKALPSGSNFAILKFPDSTTALKVYLMLFDNLEPFITPHITNRHDLPMYTPICTKIYTAIPSRTEEPTTASS